MGNLMTSGLTNALLSADLHVKRASKPMNMASRELKMRNPDMELVNRAMEYGTKELNKAEASKDKLQEELAKAREIAKEEEKAKNKARLEAKKSDANGNKVPITPSKEVIVTTKIEDLDGTYYSSTSKTPKTDTVEISLEALKKIENVNVQKILVDIPKSYTPTSTTLLSNASK